MASHLHCVLWLARFEAWVYLLKIAHCVVCMVMSKYKRDMVLVPKVTILLGAFCLVIHYLFFLTATVVRLPQTEAETERAPKPLIGVLISADPSYLKRGPTAVAGSGTSMSLAVSAIECWAASKGYHVFLEVHDLTNMDRVYTATPFASKLFAVKKYLKFVDWLLVLDSDCVIANTTKTIEEIIDMSPPYTQLTFHERLHNSEISAGIWLARKSEYTFKFIDDWLALLACVCANEHYMSQNSDNGALIMLLAETLLIRSHFTESRALFDKSNSLDAYFTFVRYVHDRLSESTQTGPISIMRAENGWFRLLELKWHSTGDFGVDVGPNVVSMWNRWLGNEFVVHTKDPELLLDHSDAVCSLPLRPHLRPEWLMKDSIEAAGKSYRSEVLRFNHPDLADCFPTCPPLFSSKPTAVAVPQHTQYCETPCKWDVK